VTEAEKAQLYAIRAIVDAILLGAGEKDPMPCPHADTEDAGSTFGNPRRRCVRCGEIVTT
jgi:hypothetical protein